MSFLFQKSFQKGIVSLFAIFVSQVLSTQIANAQIYATGFEAGTISGTTYTQSLTGSTSSGTLGDIYLGIASATWGCTSSFVTFGGVSPTSATALATNTASPSTTTWTLTIPVNSGYAANITGLQFDYRVTTTSYNTLNVTINGTTVASGSLSTTSTWFTVPVTGLSVNCITGNITVVFTFSGGSHGSGGTTRLDNVSLTGSVNALPSISVEPVNTTTSAGTSTSFNITASGASTYQWQRNTSGTSGGTWVNCDGSIDGGVYSNYNTATLNISSPTTTLNGYGYQCIVTNSVGCSVTSTGAILTVTTTACSGTPTAGSVSPSATTFCGSGSTVMSLSGGASGTGLTYQWSSNTTGTPPGTDISGSTGTSYTTPTVTTTTYYWCTTTCTTSSLSATSSAGVITVNPLPAAGSITGTPVVCVSSTTSLADASTGGTWSSTATGIATVSSSGVVTGVAAGTDTIFYSVTNSCGTASTFVVATVNPLPLAGVITGSGVVCVGATTTLADTATGGTWSSSATGTATVTTTGVVSGAASGTLTISYTNTNGCGTAYATFPMTINALPSAGSITGTTTVCVSAVTTLSDATTGGTWSSVSTGIATVSGTGVVTGVAAGTDTISYSVTNSCGTASTFVVVTVNPLPNAGVITGGDVVCVGATTTLADTTTGGTWSSSATGTATITTTGVVSGAASGTVTISYTNTNSCGTTYATFPMTINTLPSAGSITGTAIVCVAAITTLSDAITGGTWSSVSTGIATVSGTGDVTGVAAGTGTISYSVTNSCGTASTFVVVTVNPFPDSGIITGTNVICVGAATTLADTATGGTWSSGATGTATIAGAAVVTGVAGGTVTIFYTNTNSCGTVIATFPMTINPLPDSGIISGTFSACVSAITTLAETVTGGTWSSSATGIASVDISGHVTGIATGTATISYSVTNTCGTAIAIALVTVDPLPSAGVISGTTTICMSTTSTLTETVAGGTWSSSATGIAPVSSSGVVTGSSVGTAVITYSYTNSCGTADTTVTFTVNLLPTAGTITGTVTLCDLALTTLTDGITGGAWVSSNPGIATIDTAGVVNALAPGTDTIYYTVTTTCGSAVASVTITVNPLPDSGVISGTGIVCAGSTTSLSESVAGGTWSSSLTGIATVGTTGNVAGIAAGISTISYTVTNSCGTAIATKNITVDPLPVPGSISGDSTVCVSSVISLSDTVSGGTWTSSYTLIAGVSSGVVTGVSAGIDTIFYTVTNSCGTAITTRNITVNPLPVAGAITGTASLCIGSVTTLSDSVTGGTWRSGSTGIASVDSITGIVSGIATGTAEISYTVINICGSIVAMTFVTVNTIPVAGSISGVSLVCTGVPATLTDSVTGGTWSSSSTSVATITGTGIVAGISIGIDTITYTVTNSCGTSGTTFVLTVNLVPSAGTITGTTLACIGDTIYLTDTTAIGGTGSSSGWSSFLTSVATVDGTGRVAAIAGGVTAITYTISNICGSNAATLQVTVNTIPVAGSITGVSTICTGTTSTFTESVPGGTWNSSSLAVDTVSSVGVVGGVAVGADTIVYIVSNMCGSAYTIYPVTVNSTAYPGIIYGATNICEGLTTMLFDSTAGGTWISFNPGVASIDSTGYVSGISAGSATISYMVTNSCGVVAATYVITINPLPDSGAIMGLANVCVGNTITLTDASAGGVWSSDFPGIASISTGGVVTGMSVGNADIFYSVTNSCGTAVAGYSVTVNLPPTVDVITGDSILCTGSTITLNETTTGGTWASGSSTIGFVSTSGTVLGASPGSTTISYSVINSCGIAIAAKTITVNPFPATISGSGFVCLGLSATLTDATTGGVWSSSATMYATIDSFTGALHGFTIGTTTITYYLTSTGCFITTPITVSSLPVSGVITGGDSVCAGSTRMLSDASYGGIWTATNSRATVTLITGVVTGVSGGLDTIRYSVSNSCGTATATKAISVHPLPFTGSISGPNYVCTGDSIVLADTVAGGAWSISSSSFATISSGVVAGLSTGIDTVFYSLANACGTARAIKVVSVDVTPAPVSGTDIICEWTSQTYTDAGSGTWSSGTWSSSSAAIVQIDSATGSGYGYHLGTATITYSLASGCYATKIVSVAAPPSPITGSNSLCAGSGIVLIDTGAGVWSSSNSGASVGSTGGLVSGIAPGVDTIYYSVGTACSVMHIITVNAIPLPITFSDTICTGAAVTLSDAATGGWWFNIGTHATIDSVTGSLTGLLPGADTIRYVLPTGCSVRGFITVNPTPSITGSFVLCAGVPVTLSGTGGGVWNVSNPNASVGATGVAAGIFSGNDTVSFTNATGCASSVILTINPSPNAGVISAMSDSVCTGSTITLTETVGGGVWGCDLSLSTFSSSGVLLGVIPGYDTISYKVTNSCGVSFAYDMIYISGLPPAGAISGTAAGLCIGTPLALTETVPGGAWSSVDTTMVTVSNTGLVAGLAAGIDTIYYTVTNLCGSTIAPYAIVIDSSATAAISGKTYACLGLTDTLTGIPPGGAWSVSNGDVTLVGGIVTGVAVGIDTISYHTINFCGSASYSISLPVFTQWKCDSIDQVNSVNPVELGTMKVYPNPNSGNFTVLISTQADEQVNVMITNMVGQKISEYTTSTNKSVDFEITGSAGMYFITASNGSKTWVTKVLVTK